MRAPESLSEAARLASLHVPVEARQPINLRPVDAASLIILDQSGIAPKVLMGKRHAALTFMPGQFVFPGGRADRADASVSPAADLPAALAHGLMLRARRPSLTSARRLALCALRETFEETGIVIGRPASLPMGATPALWREFFATGYAPDPSGLAYLARAITPPRLLRRFDTRFFIIDKAEIAHQVAGCVGPESELTELAWLSLKETNDLPLPAITRVILGELEAWLSAPARPVPLYLERHGRFRREILHPVR